MASALSNPNGILPVTAATIQKSETIPSHQRNSARKPPGPRLKVVVRRLAPGLTREEFEAAVGAEWKVGQGKVDWSEFRPGKISKDHAKPSRPARAYLHLTDQKWLPVFSDKVRQCIFQDAKNTTRDPALIGSHSLEFAPYTRIPGGRRRNDARQGTIDQDPDFQLFLQSLTDPISKPSTTELDANQEKEKITTTPLIEHIREKKAAKDKPSVKKATAKPGKEKEEIKEEKPAEVVVASPEKTRKSNKPEKAKAVVEGVKTPQKSVPNVVKALNTPSSPAATQGAADGNANRTSERRRERTPISVAAKIQRDLGLAQPAKRREQTTNNQSTSNLKGAAEPTIPPRQAASQSIPEENKSHPPAVTTPQRQGRQGRNRQSSRPPAPPIADKTNAIPATDGTNKTPPVTIAPVILQKQSSAASTRDQSKPSTQPILPATQTTSQTQTAPSAPSQSPYTNAINTINTPTASRSTSTTNQPVPQTLGRHAFLKHANPSQGITEPLIHTALSTFGPIERVDIDRRKGFAYVDFADSEGLKRAIAASPIKIAQGAVVVLEKKERGVGQSQSQSLGSVGIGVRGGTANVAGPDPGSASVAAGGSLSSGNSTVGGIPPTGPAASLGRAIGGGVGRGRGGHARGRGPSRGGGMGSPAPPVAAPAIAAVVSPPAVNTTQVAVAPPGPPTNT